MVHIEDPNNPEDPNKPAEPNERSVLIWGPGNIGTDPCFVQTGDWISLRDPNRGIEPNDPNLVWIQGDYHLKSKAQRWDKTHQTWGSDDVTSRSIDAGNPGSPLEMELLSSPVDPCSNETGNLRINMGAFGRTPEASIPPYDWAILPDITNDGTVDQRDFAYMALQWYKTADYQPADFDRNGVVNLADLALMAEVWLKQTIWH